LLQNGRAGISLVKDVPIKFSTAFADIPIAVEDVALFQVGLDRASGQFRNIRITESKVGNPPAIKKKK
jgi:hypothetical protein